MTRDAEIILRYSHENLGTEIATFNQFLVMCYWFVNSLPHECFRWIQSRLGGWIFFNWTTWAVLFFLIAAFVHHDKSNRDVAIFEFIFDVLAYMATILFLAWAIMSHP
jgi:hypothetical protein